MRQSPIVGYLEKKSQLLQKIVVFSGDILGNKNIKRLPTRPHILQIKMTQKTRITTNLGQCISSVGGAIQNIFYVEVWFLCFTSAQIKTL